MSIDWHNHPERLEFVRGLWYQTGDDYLSTAHISKMCESRWHETVTKNAIVGKAHRCGWEARPSPIKPSNGQTPQTPRAAPTPCLPPGGYSLPRLPSLVAEAAPDPAPKPTPKPIIVEKAAECPTRIMRDPEEPLYRRDGSGCLALGCGRPLYSVLKPYCQKCADKFYTTQVRKRADHYVEDC